MSTESELPNSTGDSPLTGAQNAVQSAFLRRHGSSRMLETYLGDIEYLMREQLWGEAERLALSLPHICTALADATLVSSCERYLQWCETWVARVESEDAQRERSGLFRSWCDRSGCGELDTSSGVPVEALKRLRLRRLSRAAPPRRRVTLIEISEQANAPEQECCLSLLEAVRRWYSEWAAFDPAVQNNLARLAVLR